MPGWTRQAVDALTYDEVLGVLTEQSWQEQDRRHFALALKASNPVEAYQEIRKSVEDALAPAEPIPAERRPWYDS